MSPRLTKLKMKAKNLGIAITGTAGILIQSYDEKLLSSTEVKQCLEHLKNSNIRLSDSLIQEVLSLLQDYGDF